MRLSVCKEPAGVASAVASERKRRRRTPRLDTLPVPGYLAGGARSSVDAKGATAVLGVKLGWDPRTKAAVALASTLALLALFGVGEPAWAAGKTALPSQGAPQPPNAGAPQPPNAESELSALTCVRISACWSVGYLLNSSSSKLGQAYRFNGWRWARVSVPEPGARGGAAYDYLDGVTCSSASACWAVGYYGNTAGAALNEAVRWDGRQWRLAPIPQPAGSARAADVNQLGAVVCPSQSECWSVGTYTNSHGAYLNQVLRWNGNRWAAVATPEPGGTSTGEMNVLDSVACSAASNCLAVGYDKTSSGTYLNQVLRWNGRRWASVQTPQPSATANYLGAVACASASDCWAGGRYQDSQGAYVNEMLHWDGSHWTSVTVPDPAAGAGGSSSQLTALTCTSRAACWSVGYYNNSAGAELNQVLRYDGHTWTLVPTPQPGGSSNSSQTNTLNAVACSSAARCWATGAYTSNAGTSAQALYWRGSKWSDTSALFIPELDGNLTAAGNGICQALPVASNSITELSCRALQSTVQSGAFPGVWTMSQVASATLNGSARAPSSARQRYIGELYGTFIQYADGLSFATGLTPTPTPGSLYNTRYYDDNAWVALDLLQSYAQSHERRLVTAAQEILSFEYTGEWRPSDPPNEQQYPGGMYWNTYRRNRPIVPNAGAAQVALQLYLLTHNHAQLAFAEREYQWIRQTLGTPSGLYRARVEPGGTIGGTTNESGDGLMIGDGVLLARITHKQAYLKQAKQTAAAALIHYTLAVTEASCPAFDTILFNNLLALNRVSRIPAAVKLLDGYASWAAQQSNPNTGVFPGQFGGACGAPLPQAGVTGALILQATS